MLVSVVAGCSGALLSESTGGADVACGSLLSCAPGLAFKPLPICAAGLSVPCWGSIDRYRVVWLIRPVRAEPPNYC